MQVLAEKKPNIRQQECIDTLQGQVLALAGPGTGKTFTLIERIKNMLSKEILPEKILCLTFSETAAKEMKKRLISDAGISGNNVNVYTYHGFCNEILSNYPDDFVGFSGAKILTLATKYALIKTCIDKLDVKYLRTAGYSAYFYVPAIADAIDDIKKNNFTKETFFYQIEHHPEWKKALLAKQEELATKLKAGVTRTKTLEKAIKTLEDKINKAKEIWTIYELYTKLMREENLIDFADMINVVLEKFEKDSYFAQKISNQYEYILVDEYQDTNKAQNDIVFNLVNASESKNVFVVGDDDQIIYGFQGAQVDNIERFLTEFPDTKVICLNENMRSTQSILDYSYEVIKADAKRLEFNPKFAKFGINKKLTAKNQQMIEKDKTVRFCQFEELSQEQNYIVAEIENIINSDDCPQKNGEKDLSQIAILTRTNAELIEFSEKLKSKNIPFELKEGKNIFEIKAAFLMILYMKLLVNPYLYSDNIFSILINKPFAINPKDYARLLREKHLHKNEFFIDDIKNINPEEFVDSEKLDDIVRTYEYLKEFSNHETLKNTILEIANKTGILKYFVSTPTNQFENIMGIKKLIDEAISLGDSRSNATLEDFVEYLNLAVANNISLLTDKSPLPLNAVQLLTYHSSKGREFEYVYLPTLESWKWERNTQTQGSNYVPSVVVLDEEEKQDLKTSELIKLLFVAITRAKHSLVLSYPTAINGKTRTLTKFVPVDSAFLDVKEFEYSTEEFLSEKIAELIKSEFDYEKEIKNYIKAKTEDIVISATSVNTYADCPRQFYFSDILAFQEKDGNRDNLAYGNSVHKACQKLVDFAMANGEYPTKEEFLGFFEEDFSKQEISNKKSRLDFLDRANANLSKFYVQMLNTPVNNLYKAEYRISDFEINGVKIKGFIDRIEKLEDGTFALYDYKTGSNKTKEIEDGKSYEKYLNQLRFYKYAFEKSTGNVVSKTGIIFPDDCLENCEKFLQEEDNILIERKIIETKSNIKNMNFEPNPKNKDICANCCYKGICGFGF